MADPFSILTASAGLVDVLWRFGSYLKKIHESTGKIEEDILALSSEIQSLLSVNESIDATFKAEHFRLPGSSLADAARIDSLWRNAGTLLKDCRTSVEEMESLVTDIIGKGASAKVTGKLDGLKKTIRREKKDVELKEMRLKLLNYQNSLQVLLTALNL